jgi:hypothetical protein
MYEQAKSCVRVKNEVSEFFSSNVGVRQGENCSPVLFSLFLSGLVEFMSDAYDGLNEINSAVHDMFETSELEYFVRLYFLLYADDTVVLAESREELHALNAMFLYCKMSLKVNTTKTKVVIFSKSKVPQNNLPECTYDGDLLKVESEFSCLGTSF